MATTADGPSSNLTSDQPELDNRQWYRIVGAAVAVILGIALLIWAFSPAKGVDVATGVPPISAEHHDTAQQIIAALQALPEGERNSYMANNYPELGTSIIGQLRDRGKISPDQRVESISYRFGSLDGVVAEQAGGTAATGYFEDQLIAVVNIAGVADPLAIIVLCSNGLIEFPQDDLEAMTAVGQQSAQQMIVTLRPGEGLTDYVSYRTAMDIAARNNLPITKIERGRGAESISVAEARNLENQTDRVRVVVGVYPGDRINLADMTFMPAR